MKKVLILGMLCFVTNVLYANNVNQSLFSPRDWHVITKSKDKWSFIAEMGLSQLDQMVGGDGLGLLTRLALHRFIMTNETEHRNWGIEVGLQSGLGGNVAFSPAEITSVGGGTIQANTRASFDFLASLVQEIDVKHEIFGVVSVGGMWRQLFFNINNIPMLNKVSPELQIGLSKHINTAWELGLLYQGVYGGKMHLNADPNGQASVNQIPSQNGVLFSIFGRI